MGGKSHATLARMASQGESLESKMDAESLRTKAINNVARDLAHSLQSEVAWHENTLRTAVHVEDYFCGKLTKTFPTLCLDAPAPKNAVAAPSASSLSSQGGASANENTRGTRPTPPLIELHLLPGLRAHHLDMSNGPHGQLLQCIRCEWHNGLDTSIELAPEPHAARSQELAQAHGGSWLAGVRVTWVEVTTRSAAQKHKRSALAHELSVAAQQHHFQLVHSVGEAAAVNALLNWFAAEFQRLANANVISDFASPVHLETHSPAE